MLDIEKFIAAGLVPMPVDMPSKAPAGGFSQADWYKAKPTPDQIRAVWKRYGGSANGLALVCGHGVECLDVDLQADPAGNLDERFFEVLTEEGGEIMNKVLLEKAISGGYHLWYRMPDGIEYGSKKLARMPYTDDDRFVLGSKYADAQFGTLIETRGHGGYCICDPTPGYSLMTGDFAALQQLTEEEHALLWQIARGFNTYVEEQSYVKGETSAGSSKPGDDYNSRLSVQEFVRMLEGEGWKVISTRGNHVHLNRPGAKHAKKTDAVVVQDKKLFVPYSSSVPDFESEKGYSPFRTYAILKHRGDFRAAAKALSDQGWGQRESVSVVLAPKEEKQDVLLKYSRFKVKLGERPNLDFNLFAVDRPSRPYSHPEFFGLAFPGAIIAVVGKAKSRKTTVLTSIIAAAVSGEERCGFSYQNSGPILWVDTEQPDFYAWITHWRILVQAGGRAENLHFYSFVEKSRDEMKEAINELVLAIRPAIIVIDGIADLIRSLNEETSAYDFVTGWLRPLTFICNSTIFPVLHLNKGDGQMSGWIGTILSKKSDGTLQVEQVDDFSVDVLMREARAERPPAWRLSTQKGMHGILFKDGDAKPEYDYTIGYESVQGIQSAAESQYELEQKVDTEFDLF